MSARLTEEDAIRYRRQLIMPEIGVAGQERIKASTVMIAGIGGLGGGYPPATWPPPAWDG